MANRDLDKFCLHWSGARAVARFEHADHLGSTMRVGYAGTLHWTRFWVRDQEMNEADG